MDNIQRPPGDSYTVKASRPSTGEQAVGITAQSSGRRTKVVRSTTENFEASFSDLFETAILHHDVNHPSYDRRFYESVRASFRQLSEQYDRHPNAAATREDSWCNED